jgi:ABC-type nickel/cobalt efflux system permease component RcnA
MLDGTLAIFAGAIGLGLLHGIEPGHGWPLAAGYGLARANRYAAGMAAGAVLGIGHLISSIAVVLAFFGLQQWLDLDELGWMTQAAGVLLIAMGLWELRPWNPHGPRGHRHHHGHHHHHHHQHRHDHHDSGADARPAGADRGLWGLAGAAFMLGFAHEEEVEIIGLCAGSNLCLELMLAYALTVVAAIVALTALLIAGYRRFQHRLEHLAPHLPKLSAAILIAMGTGFLFGVL